MGDYRGEMGVGTEDGERLLEVLADGGRGATGAVDGGGFGVAGDYLSEVGFPREEGGVEGVGVHGVGRKRLNQLARLSREKTRIILRGCSPYGVEHCCGLD